MNRATRVIVAAIGILLAISGINHGIFEILQGSRPTSGLIIQAIGPEQNLWGTEEAFTIIPNFLATGILAILASLAILIWSVWFAHTKHGAAILGLLFVAQFLVGGGIAAPITFAPWLVAAASRINKPLAWWRKILPESLRRGLANIWPVTLAVGCASMLVGLFIAITGYVPGVSDDATILAVCWSFVFGGGLGMFLLTIVAGFAYDIQQQKRLS